MGINAVSTLEISIPEGSENVMAQCLAGYAKCLRELPGCIAYGVTQSAKSPQLWVLSGFWETQADMDRHFSSLGLSELVNRLGRPAISLQFGSFSQIPQREVDNAVR